MAKLILKYDASVLKEIPLKQAILTIGRTAANDLPIDNLAVSGHHAKVYYENNQFVLEDLNSLNGTFLNNQRIRKSFLKDGDEILIGKHTLVFNDEGGAPPEKPTDATAQIAAPAARLNATMVLDTKQRREMLQKATVLATEGASPSSVEKVGCLTVLGGSTDQKEYILTGRLSVIGKSEQASIKLKGWFKPPVAVAINRKQDGYTVAPSGAKAKINGQELTAPRDLKEGDIIEVAGVKLQFYFRE